MPAHNGVVTGKTGPTDQVGTQEVGNKSQVKVYLVRTLVIYKRR